MKKTKRTDQESKLKNKEKLSKKGLKPKTYLVCGLWMQSLVTKFLNLMIKGKGQGSNEPEYICKHAETVWLNILLL